MRVKLLLPASIASGVIENASRHAPHIICSSRLMEIVATTFKQTLQRE
jgi:hypothetical protein